MIRERASVLTFYVLGFGVDEWGNTLFQAGAGVVPLIQSVDTVSGINRAFCLMRTGRFLLGSTAVRTLS
jgi:hypothetical protein